MHCFHRALIKPLSQVLARRAGRLSARRQHGLSPRIIGQGIVILSLLLAGCTPALQIDPSAAVDTEPALIGVEQPGHHWWQLRFRLIWPEGEQPDFSHHLLIAEQLLLPAIVEHQQDMPLWRFHRRAGRDNSGHQFSLIFYAEESTAIAINTDIESDPLTLWLIDRGMIEKVRFRQRGAEELSRLELSSDPGWPIEIQRSWPYYIMGISQAWLTLVQELSADNQLVGKVDYPSLLLHYRDVNARLTSQWREFGQHAYLHHLSAVFGYQPVKIRSSELKTF